MSSDAAAAREQARRQNGQFGEQPHTDPGDILEVAGPDVCDDERVVEALGDGEPLTDDQRRALRRLLSADAWDAYTWEGGDDPVEVALDNLPGFGDLFGYTDTSDLRVVVDAMVSTYTATDEPYAFYAEISDDSDSDWYQASIGVDGGMRLSVGDEVKHIDPVRVELSGLRGALYIAEKVQYDHDMLVAQARRRILDDEVRDRISQWLTGDGDAKDAEEAGALLMALADRFAITAPAGD